MRLKVGEMVKHIILLGDDEDKIKKAEDMLQKFVENVGWKCDVRGHVDPEICAVREEDSASKEIAYLTISSQGMMVRIDTNDIRHIESHNHKIHIYTEEDIYIVYEKLSDVLNRLPEEFVQCHKSFLVNLNHVAAIEGKEVVLKEGKRIAISRTYHNHMKDRFIRHSMILSRCV